MKSCRDFTDLFVEMHENRADAATRQIFAEHMEACPECREDFKWYGVTVKALNSMERVQPPREFMVQLAARLDKLDSPSLFDYFRTFFSPGSAIPIPVGVTALMAIAVTGLMLYNQSVSTFFPWWNYNYATARTDGGAAVAAQMQGPGRAEHQTKGMQGHGPVAALEPAPVSSPSTSLPSHLAQSKPIAPGNTEAVSFTPTLADRIGADNLTVESASIPSAVESVERILPNLGGRLVEMKPFDDNREVLMRVMIPSNAYGDLATSLINHGAVQVGAGSGVTPPTKVTEADGKVFLYIRFQRTR
ncbi:MAG: zf-HC2 domain-containing protein [Desulfomonile sp.]|nr:zf-HC2 domain-containing protein [Desulfomonile sp.]